MLRHRLEKVESMGDEAQRGSKSVPKPAPKQVYCDVCDVYLSSAALVDTHKNGRKHTNLVKVKADKASVQKKTIFVRGFDKSLITCADLEQLFSQFGEIRNIYIDKEKNCYALVEFETDASVAKVLNQTEPLTLNDKTLKVKPKSSPKKVEKKPDHTNPSSSPVSPGSKKRKRGTSQSELSNFVTSELFKGLNSSNTVSTKFFIYSQCFGKAVEEQISVLMEHLGLSKDDLQLRDLICQLLAGVFQEFFPTCSVMPYGSSANGLGWKGSDLDLCLLLDNNPSEEDLSKDGVKQCADELGIVVKALKDLVPGCAHVVPVFSAKCPVVKFVHQPSGVSCDLTINNRLGMENTKLLRCYLSLDPRVKQLITVARAWARAAGLSRDRGGHLSNYALTLMAVYFLQITSPPVIPSLQCINKWLLLSSSTTPAHENCNCEQAKFIDGWDCSYFDDVTRVSSSENSCDIEDCRKANFGAVQEDKVLTGAVLATYAVFSEFECRVKCYTNHECLSVNLGPQVNGLRQCELNGAINDEETVLQSKMGFMYRGFKSNPCLSTPCKNGATCHVGFTSKGFRCLCAQGYQGSRCDDDKDECRTKGVCGNVSLYACVNTYGSYSCQCAAGYSQVGSTCTEATMPASANTTAISASTMATSANTTAISASTMATSANTTATSTSTMATSAITTATPISTMATLTSTMATPASTTATSASATATPTST
ncbi:speckle targeted PIP5K1A-regulated poly(A) polymerase-like isoform X3 [Nematostella vectensis]|uniref:speckle targeted PIP5K1A-regulated poly(A) polymerase-like isoform X3 n=1 Tax=Nematostella vectensis TaxID=45351 RepID=UPI0020777FFE|nr:speckle targeted PIP5K1A-regulated poly(A) polymerase-like isoform X3 [Nematostella vectensis]